MKVAVSFLLALTCVQAFANTGLLAEVGPNLRSGESAGGRVALYRDINPWLKLEGGVFGTKGGYIVDVTPTFCTPTKLYICGGVGPGYNQVSDEHQAKGWIFHDTIKLGYQITPKASVELGATHYSNGGTRYNPLFGKDPNGGLSYIFTSVRIAFP